MAKSASPRSVRQQPPEERCWTLAGLMSRLGHVVREADGKVGGEAEDDLAVVLETSGEGAGMTGQELGCLARLPVRARASAPV